MSRVESSLLLLVCLSADAFCSFETRDQDDSLPAEASESRARKRKRGVVPRIHPFVTSERERLLFVGCILALALTYFIAAQRLPGSKLLAALVLLSSSPPLEQ